MQLNPINENQNRQEDDVSYGSPLSLAHPYRRTMGAFKNPACNLILRAQDLRQKYGWMKPRSSS